MTVREWLARFLDSPVEWLANPPGGAELPPTPVPVLPVPQPPTPPIPPPEPGLTRHDYFDALSARPDVLAAYPLRTQEEIARYRYGSYPAKVAYDPGADAARWTWGQDEVNAEQLRMPLGLTRPAAGSSKVLIISDHYWDESWFTEFAETRFPDGTIAKRLDGWKWLQVTDKVPERTRVGNIWCEPQMRWVGHDPDILAWFGVRGYAAVRPPTVTSGLGVIAEGRNFLSGTLGPMLGAFKAKARTWTRAFIEIEQRAGDDYARISFWMADETQAATPIILGAEMLSGGVNDTFWIEYNTSREVRSGGPMAAWARNVVMLKDVSDPLPLLLKPVR